MRLLREIIIFCLVSFAFIYIISLFSFNPASRSILHYPYPVLDSASFFGGFGNKIASVSFFLVGKSAYFLTLPLFISILALVFQKRKWFRTVGWLILLVIASSGFYGLFSAPSEIIQGGLIGNLSGLVLKNLFGILGTTLIIFLANVLILNKLFPKLSSKLQQKIQRNFIIKEKKEIQENSNSQPIIIALKDSTEEKQSSTLERWEEFKKEQATKQTESNVQSKILSSIEYQVHEKKPENSNISLKDQDKQPKNNIQPMKDEKEAVFEVDSVSDNLIVLKPAEKEELQEKIIEVPHDSEEIYDFEKIPNYETETNKEDDEILDTAEEAMEEMEARISSSHDKTGNEKNLTPHQENYPSFEFPSLNFLKESQQVSIEDQEEIKQTGAKLIAILKEFNIEAVLSNITTGPVVTRYEIIPPKGLKVNKIVSLQDNIALGIASLGRIRIEAPIPGKSAIGIEVAKRNRQTVVFKDLAVLPQFKNEKRAIPFVLGKGISGNSLFTDISKIPHLLIAGSTGSGKSVCINSLICSVLYSKRPDEVKMLMIDPKRVELKMYDGLPHLIAPVIKETSQAILALNWAVQHMEERYKTLENYNVRNIESYNLLKRQEKQAEMPYLLLVVDEFADLMMIGGKEIEDPIIRLAAMARAVGMHLVLATQRPSVDVITGLIKANFPGRIAFKVSSKMESRIILDMNGAENLLGKGDMLFASPETSSLKRIQSPFISDEEVYQITDFFKSKYKPNYWDEILEEPETSANGEASDPSEEPLFEDAIQIVVKERKASASYLQRRLKIGYNRAARIIEMMEDLGVVGSAMGSKPREVLIDSW